MLLPSLINCFLSLAGCQSAVSSETRKISVQCPSTVQSDNIPVTVSMDSTDLHNTIDNAFRFLEKIITGENKVAPQAVCGLHSLELRLSKAPFAQDPNAGEKIGLYREPIFGYGRDDITLDGWAGDFQNSSYSPAPELHFAVLHEFGHRENAINVSLAKFNEFANFSWKESSACTGILSQHSVLTSAIICYAPKGPYRSQIPVGFPGSGSKDHCGATSVAQDWAQVFAYSSKLLLACPTPTPENFDIYVEEAGFSETGEAKIKWMLSYLLAQNPGFSIVTDCSD